MTAFYDEDCCWGEVIRNICVNCGIDPDTDQGITRNVTVQLVDGNQLVTFNYNPHQRIDNLKSKSLHIVLSEC
jgi:hypothetical protein